MRIKFRAAFYPEGNGIIDRNHRKINTGRGILVQCFSRQKWTKPDRQNIQLPNWC